MKPHLSPTQITMFSRCGMQYYYRYVEGRKLPPGVSQVIGTTVHDVAARILEHKRDKGTLPPVEYATEIAYERSRFLAQQDVLLTDEEKQEGADKVLGAAIDTAVEASKVYHAELAPAIQPLDIERPWRLELDGFPYDLEGRLDCRESDGRIRDLKVVAKSVNQLQDEADASIALTAYHLAASRIGGPVTKTLALDAIRMLKKNLQTATILTTRSENDHVKLLRRIERMVAALERGIFMPCSPDAWVCSPRWCGYYGMCPYGEGGS